MGELDALSAWNDGVTLLGALEKFTDQTLFSEYEELYLRLFSLPPAVDLRILFKNTPPKPLPYDPVLDLNRYNQLGGKLKSEILELLGNGKLISVGYLQPRKRNQQPERIPADRWIGGLVGWDTSELWGHGYGYGEIRVLRHEKNAAEIAASIPVPEPRRRPGRPSSGDLIKKAYEALREQGNIDFTSFRRNIAPIRQLALRLRDDPSNEKGLKDETIRSILAPQFKSDREQRFGPEKSPGKPPGK